MSEQHLDDFTADRPRLVGLAARLLGDAAEAEDVVQQAWLRLAGTDTVVASLPAWLTTVTTRLCLDRLKARTPYPVDDPGDLLGSGGSTALLGTPAADPADVVGLTHEVGSALDVVLDRLGPHERVAFVLHDSFAVEFATIAELLETTPAAARKLASRARAKVAVPAPVRAPADWEVVDAFMAAAREGEFERLLELLAPDAFVRADDAALLVGTPGAIDGGRAVAEFFNGSAHAALPVFVDTRPGAAWFHRGAAQVVFDFTIAHGRVAAITFRAEAQTLAEVARRDGAHRR